MKLRPPAWAFFVGSPSSAGILHTEAGDSVRFRGPFCASEGDLVTLVGHWKTDPKYGRQFAAESLSYELPESAVCSALIRTS
ncbi:MAG: YrrC family ATP-dependent DNA helicase [Pirellulaceae bacterium]